MMTPYNSDIKQSLKWMHGNAPNVESLVNQKVAWYNTYQEQFWTNWESGIFNLATAGPFGLMIWCIILGVPSSLFDLYAANNVNWAYGANRQNFVYSGIEPTLPSPNVQGGNFYGGNNTLFNLQEARWALMLRYVALISNGRLSFINKMLNWIFNNDQPWNFAGKVYFYAIDNTAPAQTLVPTAPVTQPMYIEYRIGANFVISSQFLAILNSPQYGIVPTCAGSSYLVVQET